MFRLFVVSVIEDACGGSLPHPQTTPPSNLPVLCEASSTSQGLAGRGQDENNCNAFRCEILLLRKTYAATTPEGHGTNEMVVFQFVRLCCDFVGLGPLGDSFEEGTKKNLKSVPGVSRG